MQLVDKHGKIITMKQQSKSNNTNQKETK
ncbi:MAG: hypothetical protein HW374_1750, partial [Bacteroidetes bacterium]|nr:hypothetical protein [Bacteroidota bacterium]